MDTLEELLRARIGAHGANVGILDVRGGKLHLIFGAVGRSPKTIVRIEGDSAELIHPKRESVSAGETDDGTTEDEDESGEVRRAVAIDRGEYVDDADPLQPGEAPLAALARVSGGIPKAPQAEAVTETAAVATTTEDAPGLESGTSSIINPQDDAKPQGDVEASVINADDHSKDELLALAESEGVEVGRSMTKQEIADAINTKRAG